MLGFQRLAGAVLWSVLILVRWCHGQFIVSPAQWWLDTVVTTAEESTKTAVREVFAVSTRIINGVATWLVALFLDRDFYNRTRRGEERRRTRAWQAFWAHSSKVGTLNAVIEQEGYIPASPPTPNKNSMPKRKGDPSLRRSGSELFNRPAGFAVAERAERRGLAESVRLSIEISIETVFSTFRSMVSRLLMLQYGEQQHPHRMLSSHSSHKSHFLSRSDSKGSNKGGVGADAILMPPVYDEVTPSSRKHHTRSSAPLSFRRKTRSFGSWEELSVWTASDAILHCGYPLEEHIVTTADGYVLTMQRLPRKESRDVVFFQHGVLDTSLGWVANGPQGSQAFAAFDRGADVWLGNSRANPPRAHTDPQRSGAAYWCFSINELGMEDVAAMIHRIHTVKCVELGDLAFTTHGHDSSAAFRSQLEEDRAVISLRRPSPEVNSKHYHHQRSGSDSAVASMHRISVAIENAFGDDDELVDGQNDEGRSQQNPQKLREPKEKLFGAGGSPTKLERAEKRGNLLRQRSLGSLSFLLRLFNDNKQETKTNKPLPPLHPDASQMLDRKLYPNTQNGSAESIKAIPAVVPPLPLASVLRPRCESAQSGGSEDSQGLMPDRMSVRGRETACEDNQPGHETMSGIPESSMGRYNLRAVGHSLGGASLLIYAVMCQKLGKPHHISRLVLLTPAGFHRQYPIVAGPFLYLLPLVMKLLRMIRPGVVSVRLVFNKTVNMTNET